MTHYHSFGYLIATCAELIFDLSEGIILIAAKMEYDHFTSSIGWHIKTNGGRREAKFQMRFSF